MEARALGRSLMVVLVLSLLKPAAGGFLGSPVVTETYLPPDTEESEQSTSFPASPGAVIREGTASASTSGMSALHPSFPQRESHTVIDQSSFTEVTESWTTQNRSDTSTEFPDSSLAFSTNTVNEWEDPSAIANMTDAYTVSEEWQPASEFRTVRDLTLTQLTEQKHTDQDTTESGSNSESTYISTTFTRAGERTLLSVTSNSTSPYVEDTSGSISETASHAVTGQVEKTGVTQHTAYTNDGLFTQSGHSDATSEDFSTNATQKVFETEVSHGSQMTQSHTGPQMTQSHTGPQTTQSHTGPQTTQSHTGPQTTQSHTGQPTVTGSDFESKTSNPSSTPPLTVINSSDSEADTTVDSSTNQTFYIDNNSSSPSFIPPDETHTNMSHQDGETTEMPTGTMSTSGGEKPDEPQTFMEGTLIPGLTTELSTLLDMTTSVDEFQSTQQTFVSQTGSHPEPTEVLSTITGPSTDKPPLTEEDTHVASTVPITSTTLASTATTVPFTTHQFQASTTAGTHSTPHSTTQSATETTQKTTPTTEQHHPTTETASPSLSASSSQSGANATDLSTRHFETSTATPGRTTAHSQHTTASYNKSTPTMSTVGITTGKRTVTEATTSQMPVKISLTPGHVCGPQTCANGGKCVLTLGGYRCECLPAWRGENCTDDVDECVSSPCSPDSVCVNTRGSFFCCVLGYDLQDGQRCTQTKTFLGIFTLNGSLHDSHKEILQLLNASLSNLHGYRRSTLRDLNKLQILAVNMFSMSADVTSIDVFCRIQTSLRNCTKPQSHCFFKLQHQLTYQVKDLCSVQKKKCDTQYAVCNDTDGIPYCQCHEGYFKKNPEDSTCRDCGDGFKLVNGTCMKCPFGFGGFNCSNFYGLIAKVVCPAAVGLLLIVIIALIVTCCKKDKNDINKIIFKSGDLQMSPYGEFPKSSRVSMEWGRETIEMQENGSTKNLLQMTDIYYSPALRNADLERNGLYPFSGLPGSRHSCIYPAQWNPSFISDDSRRRDYF